MNPADLQARGQESRLSWAESFEGLPHSPTWTAVCKSMLFTSVSSRRIDLLPYFSVDGEEFARGAGSQKHLAKDAAAKVALQKLKDEEAT